MTPDSGSDHALSLSAPYRRRQLAVLVGITLIAAVLRLFKLGEWAFWVDEAHTFRDVVAPDDAFWASNVSNYPLSYLTVRWLLDVGVLETTGEGWLRLPFAFFGILTVPAVAVFGRSVVGRRAALLAAGFLALSPWHLYWSQNARGYAMTLFFASLAAFAVHRAARHRSILLGLAAAGLAVLAGLAHPTGALLGPVLVAFFMVEIARDAALRRTLLRPWVLGVCVVAAVVAAVWLGPTIAQAAREKPEFSIVHLAQTFAWFLGPTFIVASIGGAAAMVLRSPRRETWFLILWAVVPLLVVVVLGASVIKVTAQYGMVVLPAMFLLTSRLIVQLADAIPERTPIARVLRWSLPFVLLAGLASEDFLYFMKRNGDRPLWRDAATFVQADTPGPKTVWTTNEPSLRYYFDRGSFWGRPQGATLVEGLADWRFAQSGGGAAWFASTVAAAQAEGRPLFFVLTEPELEEWDRDGSFDRALRAGAFQLRRLLCNVGPKDMTVLVYKVEPRQPPVPR